MKLPTTPDGKPVLDEATFQKLLAAAYVLQEHRERTQAAQPVPRAPEEPNSEYAHTLAEIVEIQHQILMRRLDLDGAAGYVVEQLQRITSSTGAAVALLDRDHLVYRAVSGVSAGQLGSALPKEQSLSAAALAQGMIQRCPNTRLESNIDPTIAKRINISSFVAVPIFHDDRVAGVLELVFTKANGYAEYDVHTCQMMAGLVTEALARADDEKWKKNLAAERDSMLQALEKLKPQLDRLAKDAESLSSSTVPEFLRDSSISAPAVPIPAKVPAVREPMRRPQRVLVSVETECHKCGNHLGEQEVYCGSCGTLRSDRPANGSRPGHELPLVENGQPQFGLADEEAPEPLSARMPKPEFELPPEVLALVENEPTIEPLPDVADELLKLLPPEDWEGQTAFKSKSEAAPAGYPWTSAANARAWLNTVSDPKSSSGLWEFMRVHRGDVSLVAAILLVLVAIFWSRTDRVSSSVNTNVTTSAKGPSPVATLKTEETDLDPQAQLSFWERTLIALGLAEPPVAPQRSQPMGNPGVSVWVDLHTALYYCSDAELYGKTPKGRYAKQGEAQSERFEPASGKVCE